MATSAFKSTTRRTSIDNTNSSSSSGSHHRRSRSVSRFSHRVPAEEPEREESSASRKGKFVNTVRGSGFPEISLDDLAIEMFSLTTNSSPSEDVSSCGNNRRGRTLSKSNSNSDDVAQRRGRSLSRRGSRVSDLRSSGGNININNNSNVNVNNNSSGRSNENSMKKSSDEIGGGRRRRSLSVVPNSYLVCDSENELFEKNRRRANNADPSTWHRPKLVERKPAASNQQRGLRRCSSQKDLLSTYDGYSSYSSTLTDDEGNDARYNAYGIGKGMKAAYVQNKGPKASIRDRSKPPDLAGNDGRHSAGCGDLKAVCTVRKNYESKLEKSEQRKQELLAEIMLEEERGKELKKMVGELLPNPKAPSPIKRPTRGRKRSKDRNRAPKQLVEEADKIIEDFISSVEETDISSFDGERSDASSVVGGTIKPMFQYGDAESFRSPLRSDLLPAEMDGVSLPWLKWETGNDGTPLLGNANKHNPATPKTVLQDALEDMIGGPEQERSVNSKSSRGSWSPGVVNSFSMDAGETCKNVKVDSCKSQLLSCVPRKHQVDVDDYLKRPSMEDFISEVWRQRGRIGSGGLLICNGGSIGKFLL